MGAQTIPSRRYSHGVSQEKNTRQRILDAAEEVVLREGVAHLTLEAVAATAGTSKGGLLYHFPTRDALVAAMVDRLGAAFERDLELCGHADAGGPGSFTRAYVRATFSPPSGGESERERRLGVALIAGVAADPALLESLRARFAAWQARVEADGLPVARATAVRLAADGLWLIELFGLAPLREDLRRAVGEELEALASREGARRRPAPSGAGER
jgi:AcrR family transcriptional regulator